MKLYIPIKLSVFRYFIGGLDFPGYKKTFDYFLSFIWIK